MQMPPQAIEKRVERLERLVIGLEHLPERVAAVESQIVQLRSEMHDEFSAIRQEVRGGDEETRREMRELTEETRRMIGEGDEETRRMMREGMKTRAAICACCMRRSSADWQ
jgi:archaellum component FlaC